MLEKTKKIIINLDQKAEKAIKKNKNVFIAVLITSGAILALSGVVHLFKRRDYILCCKCHKPKASESEKED